MVVLYVAAGLCEALGLYLAARGFRRTWREFGTEERFTAVVLRPIAEPTRDIVRRIDSRARRLLGRPPRKVTGTVSGTAGITFSSSMRGRVRFGPLPSITDDPEGFAAAVDERLRRVLDQVQTAQEATADETTARTKEVSTLRGDLEGRLNEVEGMSRNVAVGGLAEQVYGWFFVVVGVALGTLGNVVQAAL